MTHQLIPWSPSTLDTFVNCPHQFYETKIAKNFIPEKDADQLWGTYVHKKFQERQEHRLALPQDLQNHEAFMMKLEATPGIHFCEKQMALDRQLKPCYFFDNKNCFCRGVLDWQKVDEPSRTAWLCDYKTGKYHEKFKQLALYAIFTFNEFPFVDKVIAAFYWTQTMATNKREWTRADIATLWDMFIPDLRQYKEAFNGNVWQKRPSGLCKGWCPVANCEHYQPKRR